MELADSPWKTQHLENALPSVRDLRGSRQLFGQNVLLHAGEASAKIRKK